MLTEYSTRNDIRIFRDKVFLKYEEMKLGWLGKDINRWMILNRKKADKCMMRSFKVENQEVILEIYPSVLQSTNRASKKFYSFALGTYVETKNGKIWYSFAKTNNEIHMYTPHYFKRHKERFMCDYLTDFNNTDIVPYTRNGRKYEFWVCLDSVMVTRRVDDDFIYHITFLHKDQCTGKNYKNLFERIGSVIDECDIYEWK